MGALEIIAIVLSLVALAVTVIGFFASMRFYRDGIQMQTEVQSLLTKIESRASAIQTQIGGMFDRTLDAALGRVSPEEAEKQQRQLLHQTSDELTSEPGTVEPPETASGLSSDTELARAVSSFYTFNERRLTDVTDATGRAVFNLGSHGRFNLYDGATGLLFLGYFVDVEPSEIVARTRSLFGNVEISYQRLEQSVDAQLRDQGIEVLGQISVEILVNDEVDTPALIRKINEYQPNTRNIDITFRRPAEITAAVADEYRRMEP